MQSRIYLKKELEILTGGIVKAHTFFLQDNDNFMKQKAFKIGRETVYKIEDIIEWLNSNYEEIFKQHNHGLAIFMIISSRNGPVFFEEKQMIKMT